MRAGALPAERGLLGEEADGVDAGGGGGLVAGDGDGEGGGGGEGEVELGDGAV